MSKSTLKDMGLWNESMNNAMKYHRKKEDRRFSSEQSQRKESFAVHSRLAVEMNKMEEHHNFRFGQDIRPAADTPN